MNLNNRIRTSDLRNYSPPLYQLSYIEKWKPMPRLELGTFALQVRRINHFATSAIITHSFFFLISDAHNINLLSGLHVVSLVGFSHC